MGARARTITAAVLCTGLAATSFGAPKEPAPVPVAYNPDKLDVIVLKDASGNLYVVVDPMGQKRDVFFGKGKTLHQQQRVLRSAEGTSWTLAVWTPRVAEFRSGYIKREENGTFIKSCWGADDAVLTELTGDKAQAVLDKSQFLSPLATRGGFMLARDDAGVYYYVDKYTDRYGGKGYRVWVGRKGAMKQLALTDVADDSAGQVFSTKTGQLRLVVGTSERGKDVTWVKGVNRTPLVYLEVGDNGPLVYRDLGIYRALGTICDNV